VNIYCNFCLSERRRSFACERSSQSRNLLFASAPVYLLYVFVAAFFPTLVLAQELPKGWRRPTKTEVSNRWRLKSTSRFVTVEGDFDGDGRSDIAELLVNPSRKQLGLFVRLSSDQKWQLLDKPYAMGDFDRFGIDYVKPGKYETACGKGYGDWACAHEEPEWLKLARPAIDFFYTESSDSIFYWDQNTKRFREVVMSD
jgi:hypothetical protein